MKDKIRLSIELFSIFYLIPFIITISNFPIKHLLIPIILLVALIAFIKLKNDKSFDKSILFEISNKKQLLKIIVIRWLLGLLILTILIYFTNRSQLFDFPRKNTMIYIFFLFLYPLFSAFPQELIFRSYFFHRFRNLFSSIPIMIFMSGLSFGFAHIIFQNWISPFISFLGGIMFARTYSKSNSLVITAIEHGIWGDLIFTVGLGIYFFSGNIN
ncbi:MAG: CPBP family intramembrane metalloprotease [Ignavibacteriae bacterium]|nr:CPBP family intramembrane metalloprotease [Ignavibacteriota bacterium]